MSRSVCLNMIVKNEAPAIEKCLASVKNWIDYWVIVDTGSTDGTQTIIQDFLQDIPGELFEQPWVDFAFNRNQALARTKNKADYTLFIDADERLIWNGAFFKPSLDKDLYMGIIEHGSHRFLRTLLVNNRFDWKWVGIVHEMVACPDAKEMGFFFQAIVYSTLEGNRSQDMKKKLRQDIALMEQVAQTDPENSRNRLHLARNYEGAQEYALALKNYELRAAKGGDDPEVYYSFYRMGIIQKELKDSSEKFLNHLLKAHTMRPWRAEPLFAIANYFIEIDVYTVAYLVSKFAVSGNLFDDYFLVTFEIYQYGILSLYAESSYKMGQYQEAYDAMTQLLAVRSLPDDLRESIQKNWKLLQQLLASK